MQTGDTWKNGLNRWKHAMDLVAGAKNGILVDAKY